jgi:hypothetical protein
VADARVSALEVREIVTLSADDDTILGSFVDTAHLLVDTYLIGGTCQHSDAILKKIELYLAAHFASLSEGDGTVKFAKMGDASESYETDDIKDGLRSTRYGQTAIMLDTCGILANMASAGLKAEFRVV